MTPPAARWREYRHETWVAGYAAAWLALLAVPKVEGGWLSAVHNALYFGMGALTTWSQVEAGRRIADDARTRRAWYMLAASSAVLFLGGGAWTAFIALRPGSAAPGVATWVDLSYIPFAFAAFVAFPADPGYTLRDRRTRLDGALFVLGAAALSWHFALRPVLAAPAGSMTLLYALQVVGEWVVAIAASAAMLRTADRTTRVAVGFALAGHLMYILTDFFWTEARGSYVPGHWVDALWFGAWIMRWIGARRAIHGTPGPVDDADVYHGGLAPSLFVVGAYFLLLLALLLDELGGATDIAVAATAMTALLLLRQRVALADNRRLALATAMQAARFRALVASAMDYVLVVGEDLRVTYASPSVERLSGALVGEPFLELLHADDRDGMRSWLAERPATLEARAYRCRLRVAAGDWRDVEFRVQDRRTDPLVLGFVVNGRDIGAELALESQLGHARKLATLSAMAGRIAHAFNNTLAVLQGHAEMLAEDLPPDQPAREDARAIRAAAERGAGITRQLLGFSGRHVIRPELVRPSEVIGDLLPTLGRLLPPGIAVEVEGPGSQLAVRVDRAQFEQVLVNLVANARDGMPDGGRLRLSVAERSPAGAPVRTEVAIAVSDEGVGIPDEVRGRIFEPFFTTKPPGRGTGLGLAMVASIVKRAGGRVEVESAAGRGTTFTIVLPVDEARGTPVAPVAAVVATPASGSVLLVDDDTLVRGASRRMLQRAGYAVLEAHDGALALAIAARPEVRIDVLLTDLMMPGLSGRDIIPRFRELRPGVPIVCVTGFATERESDSPLALDVHAIVAKPFTAETLTGALAGAIADATR